MEFDLAAWAANKTVQLIFGVLALLGVIATPVAVYEAVQINGFLWWDGLKDQAKDAKADLAIQTDNVDVLTRGLNSCNLSVDRWKKVGDAATAKAQANIDKLGAMQGALDEARRRLATVPKSSQVCPAVEAIFSGAFK